MFTVIQTSGIIRTIADLNARNDLQLLTDSQDVKAILGDLGQSYDDYQGLFIKVENCEYIEIWGFSGTVPYLHNHVENLLN